MTDHGQWRGSSDHSQFGASGAVGYDRGRVTGRNRWNNYQGGYRQGDANWSGTFNPPDTYGGPDAYGGNEPDYWSEHSGGGPMWGPEYWGWGGRGYEPGFGRGYGWENIQRVRSRNWGEYSGRGPRNYRRPDDRIREDINDRLTDDAEIDPSDVEVQVSNGEVTLQGRVDSRRDKRLAEDIAWGVSGVGEVHNRLNVTHRQEDRQDERRQAA